MEARETSSPVSAPPSTPLETPHAASLFSASRKTSGRVTPMSSFTPSSAPIASAEENPEDEADQEVNGETLDPRRLTPNLHANLVSEILSLRREIESKDNLIDKLEGSLADSRSESDDLQNELLRRSKETKAIKLQLQSIEDGTLTALEDLSRERDQAVNSAAEHKKRFEEAQRQLKVEAEKNDRLHKDWETEKSKWTAEKGQLQRKHDIAENRLKAIVEELSLQQTAIPENATETRDFAAPGDGIGSLHSSPVKIKSHIRNRSSISTIGSPRPESLINGPNLADELADDDDGIHSEAGLAEERQSRVFREADVYNTEKQDFEEESGDAHLREIEQSHDTPRNVQSQASPTVLDSNNDTKSGHSPDDHGGAIETEDSTLDAQTRPYALADGPMPAFLSSDQSIIRNEDSTTRDLQSHQTTPSSPTYKLISLYNSLNTEHNKISDSPDPQEAPSSAPTEQLKPRTSSSSTQTDATQESSIASTATPPSSYLPSSKSIPEISVHPPQSSPPSPNSNFHIPTTKDSATQTPPTMLWESRSIAVQTDIIRVDRRQFKLPAHLLPSALDNLAPRQLASPVDKGNLAQIGPLAGTTSEATRSTDLNSKETPLPRPMSEGEADDRGLPPFQRSFNYAGKQSKAFENDPFQPSDDLYFNGFENGPSTFTKPTRRMQKSGKQLDPPAPVPENEKVTIQQPSRNRTQASAGSRASFDRVSMNARTNVLTSSSKGKDVRTERSPTPTSVASSSAWSRATSVPSGLVIPTRTSSVGVRPRKLNGNTSPTFRSGASSPTKASSGKRVGKKPILRKARSTSLAPSEIRGDAQRSATSPFSQTSFASGETSPPPVPENSVLQIYRASTHQRSSSSQTRRLSAVYPTGNASVGTSIQHSIVDAIAATMVGEWMWKYVRKRKAFGSSESYQDSLAASEQRHKRWVWLSPWERTLMWSSKQPTTNSALLGKVGRKVTIQSVLDVKDEKASARKSSNSFNRSILVLTPSRAIKFTAETRERHYLWLTALSFLAHHTSQGDLDLSFLPKNLISPSPTDEAAADISRTTSATASRSGRKPWASFITNRSQQSSGFATPSVPQEPPSHDAEIGGGGGPPKPTRPAPQAPAAEIMPSDSALAPTVPRIPGGASNIYKKDIFGVPAKHNRNRSASATGAIPISRPTTRKSQNRTASAKSYPNTGATNSSNQSTKSNINIPAGQRGNVPLPPTPALSGSAPSVPSSTLLKYFGGQQPNQIGQQQQQQPPPQPPQVAPLHSHPIDLGMYNSSNVREDANFDPALNAQETEDYNLGNKFERTYGANEMDIIGTEFGGNSRFFDAVGGAFGSPPTTAGTISGPAAEAMAAPTDWDPAPPHPPRAAPPPPLAGTSTNFRHISGESFDSVAPPPIQRWPNVSSQRNNRELGTKGSQSAAQGYANEAYVGNASWTDTADYSTAKPFQQPNIADTKPAKSATGKRSFWSLGKGNKGQNAIKTGLAVS